MTLPDWAIRIFVGSAPSLRKLRGMGGPPMVFGEETRAGRPCHEQPLKLTAGRVLRRKTVRGADPTRFTLGGMAQNE
jgi:hypothetical protein